MRGERIDLSRIPMDDRAHLPGDPGGRHHRRLPDREPGADADAPRTPAREPRRPHGPGGAGAPGADPGRRRASLPGAPRAAAQGPVVPRPLRAPVAGADPARHAGDDRLPGAGDPGRDGARRVQRRRGRGAAPGDEPKALRGGDPRLSRPVHRRGERARRDARRWPSGSSSRSGASRGSGSRRLTRSPSACSPISRPGFGSTTAPSSSARSSTSSRWASTRPTRWCTRRSARGIEVLPPDVNRSAGCRSCDASRSGRGWPCDRPGLHNRARGGGRPGAGRRSAGAAGPTRTSPTLRRAPAWAATALELIAWAGACERIGGRRRPAPARGSVAARRRRGGASGWRRRPSSSPSPSPSRQRPRCASSTRGSGWWPTTRQPGSRSPSTRCRSSGPASTRDAHERGPGPGAGRQAAGGRRDGRRAPAARDRARRRLHAARGRARHDQRRRAAARLRAPSPGREDGILRARERQAGAPRAAW